MSPPRRAPTSCSTATFVCGLPQEPIPAARSLSPRWALPAGQPLLRSLCPSPWRECSRTRPQVPHSRGSGPAAPTFSRCPRARGPMPLPACSPCLSPALHGAASSESMGWPRRRERLPRGRRRSRPGCPTRRRCRRRTGCRPRSPAYADAAYQGWSVSRYLAADARWQLADGTPGFSEDIGIGLLAESITRGTWQRMFPLWSSAVAQQQRRAPQAALSFTTSAYTGGTRDFAKALQDRTAQQVVQVRALLERSDNQLLLTRGVVTLLADHASPDLLQKTSAFLAGRTPSSMDIPAVAGLVGALLDYSRAVRSDDALVRLLKDAIDAADPSGCSYDTRGCLSGYRLGEVRSSDQHHVRGAPPSCRHRRRLLPGDSGRQGTRRIGSFPGGREGNPAGDARSCRGSDFVPRWVPCP